MFKICLSFSFRPHFATRYTHFISSDFSKNFRRTHSFGFLGGYKQALFVVVKKENLLLMKWNLSFFSCCCCYYWCTERREKGAKESTFSFVFFLCEKKWGMNPTRCTSWQSENIRIRFRIFELWLDGQRFELHVCAPVHKMSYGEWRNQREERLRKCECKEEEKKRINKMLKENENKHKTHGA